MTTTKFATLVDDAEKQIKAKVAELLSIAHDMAGAQRRALADKLEGIVRQMRDEVSKSDTAVLFKGKKETA